MKGLFDFLKENKTVREFLDEYGPQVRKMAVICLAGLVLFAGFSLFKSGSDSARQDRSAAGAWRRRDRDEKGNREHRNNEQQ